MTRPVYNPLDRVELGRSVGQALLSGDCERLPPDEKFAGAGIYAIYYHGSFGPYERVALPGCRWPIYVGRAMPAGGRAGLVGLDAPVGSKLFDRLRQHARSIILAENLDVRDFRCRCLVVDDIWIPLAERLLIGHYRPLWNGVIDGFGIHAPGSGRAAQARSTWDTLHPGRTFAEGLPPGDNLEEVEELIDTHLDEHPPEVDQSPLLSEDPFLGEADDSE